MPDVRSYRDLLVWQKSMRIVRLVYEMTATFPKEEMYGLSAQARRSAVSIPSNIAEGYGRHSTPDYLRFLRIAMGSLFELQTQLEIAHDLKYTSNDRFGNLNSLLLELERMLSSMIRKIDQQRR